MNRKLILLNVALAAFVVYDGVQLHGAYEAEKAREAALKAKRIPVLPAPPFRALPNEGPVLPSGYKDVAMKNLFHPSRDPNVPVELPPPPPPPPPMPDLPKFHGQMNLGDGPMALLVEKPGMPEKAVKPGESIGQFKLVDVTRDEIAFAWNYNGQIARRGLRELADNSAAAAPAADNRPASATAPPPPPPMQAVYGPGELTGFGFKTCVPNDTTPEGSIVQGFRKTITTTPFGKSCRWDPVK
ncbi:MAG: hypothetical protein ABI759_23500 [Candidatus Solibacter sp.]